MLNIFLCGNIICHFCLAAYIVWKACTHFSPNFLETVKKLANVSDLLARPDTSSMTISLSSFIFSPKKFSSQCAYCLWKCSNKSSNSSIFLGYLKPISSSTKHSLMLFSLPFESGFFWQPNYFFNFPKHFVFSQVLNKGCFPISSSANYWNIPFKFCVVTINHFIHHFFKYCFILLNEIRFLIYVKNFLEQTLRFNSTKYNLGCFFIFFCNGRSLLVRVDYFHPFFKTTEEIFFLLTFFHLVIN